MINKEDWMMIEAQIEKGVYQKDIAETLGVHPKTVGRALKRRGPPSGKRPSARKSKLDPFKPMVDDLIRQGVWNAVVILHEITEKGYTGRVSILREYIRPMRPLRASRATVRFETAPGEQMQSDWGEMHTAIGGDRRKVYFIVDMLGYSRRFHFWCTDRDDAEHTYEGIIRSFEHFGGVSREVLVDNQKTAVISHRVGAAVRYNERFVDMAGHYGFVPRACRPCRARTKGKDERMVGYIKHHFFVRYRSFESLGHMNALALKWLSEEADGRLHGTVREVVRDRFAREAPCLEPLPAVRYDTSYREHRQVHWDGYIDVLGNRYSVPDDLRGKTVEVRIGFEGQFSVFYGEEHVVTHRLQSLQEGWVTVSSHHAALWRDTLSVERRDLSVYEEVIRCSL